MTPNDAPSDGEVTPVGIRVISVMDLGEDALKQCGIQPGMRVYDLECGTGDASLAIAKLVGHTGLVVGIDVHILPEKLLSDLQLSKLVYRHWLDFPMWRELSFREREFKNGEREGSIS